MMDVQQILALAIVAAAAVLLAIRAIRQRKRAKFKACANCQCADGQSEARIAGKS